MRALALVGAAAAAGVGIALAAGAGGVTATPPVFVVRPPLAAAGSGAVTLTNGGAAPVTISEVIPDGTCAPGVTASAPLPLTLGAGSAHAVGVTCPAVATPGAARCTFHARTASHAPVVDVTALCVTPAATALPLSAGSGLDLGDVPIGAQRAASVTLTNPGPGVATAVALALADAAGDFSLGAPCVADGPGCTVGTALAPGATLAVDVRCAPTQLGPRRTDLYVVTATGAGAGPVPITCAGVSGVAGPSLAVDVPSVDLGGVAVASGAVTSVVHVTNIGTSDLHIGAIGISGGASADWAVAAAAPCAQAPCTLAAGASVPLTLTFAPSALDARRSTLELRSDDAAHPTVQVSLDGRGLGAALATTSPGGLDLGSVAVGATSALSVGLRADGNAPLAPVTLALTQDDTAFSLDAASVTLGASGSATVTITCAPPAAVVYTGTLTVTAAAALAGSPLAYALTCTGTTGSLVAAPSPLALGEIRTGSGPVTTTVTLATLGPAVTITAPPALATPSAALALGDVSSTSVTGGAPATFTVTVDPQADGPLADHVTLAAGGQALDLPVTGAVVTAAAVASASRDLGSFCVGAPTTPAVVSLAATGTASIGLPTAPAMAQGAASAFALAPVEPSAFPFVVPAGARATAQVTPLRQPTAGVVTDDVVWADDIAGAAAPRTTVKANFIDTGGAISPGSIEFGAAPIHRTDPAPQLITLQNCGTEAMTLGAPEFAPSGAFFTVGALPAQLLPAQAATLAVGFGPVAVGDFTATLTVPATKGAETVPLVVTLHGVGEVQPSGGGVDAGTGGATATSGCGCHASGDPAAGLAVLAAGLVAGRSGRRRRRVPWA